MPRTTGVTGAQDARRARGPCQAREFFKGCCPLDDIDFGLFGDSSMFRDRSPEVQVCARLRSGEGSAKGHGARAHEDQQWCACAGATQFARDGIASDHPWLGRGRQRCRATGACCKPRREPRGGRARGGVHAAGERGGRPVHARAAQPGAVDDAKLLHQPSPVLGRGGDSTRELRGRRRCVSTARRCGRTGE